ncbi:MAG: exodeoxyribonuclease V subunit gamma, partial [Verrucomicrobia bacterium]|nr:exodeoxyribonuclease V subunit gamma [Verrucomicrobiota bacterium]
MPPCHACFLRNSEIFNPAVAVLKLYQGNDLEGLARRLSERIAIPSEGCSALDPETIVVQSQGMHHWLSMQIAQRLGVAANINYPFPEAFAQRLFDSNVAIRTSNRFSPNTMVWSIFGALPGLLDQAGFDVVSRYLESDDTGIKAYQLSERLSGLLDHYGIYRPDMLLDWTRGRGLNAGHAAWQSKLWRVLVKGAEREHPSARQQHFLNATSVPVGLPARVFVFGITSLPPFYLQVLEHVATFVDVHMFVQSPCRAFWGHAQSERTILKEALAEGMSIEHFKQRFHHESGNPLLTSMGRHIQNFSAMLPLRDDLPVEEEDISVPPIGDSLLARLQQDIFSFTDGAMSPHEA